MIYTLNKNLRLLRALGQITGNHPLAVPIPFPIRGDEVLRLYALAFFPLPQLCTNSRECELEKVLKSYDLGFLSKLI